MNRVWLSGLLALAVCSSSVADETAKSTGDLELVVMNGKCLLRMRITVECDSRPLAAVWDDKFEALTKFFDFNDDGQLNEAEATRLPSVQALREVLSIGFAPQIGDAPAWKELDANADGQAAAAEVAAFYRRAGLGSPVVGVGMMPFSADLTRSLVGLLDLDGDKQVDEKEWTLAPQALAKLDRNDDELVGAGELVSRVLYPGAAGGYILTAPNANRPLPDSLAKLPLVLLPADLADIYWTQVVVAWRDGNGDRKLSAEESGFGAAVRAVLDADDDGLIAPSELAAWRNCQPDIKCVVRLSSKAEQRPALTTEPASSVSSGVQLVIRADEGKVSKTAAGVHEHFTREFAAADTDSDGILAGDEITNRKEGVWQSVSQSADRNGDSQLSKAELNAWLGLQENLAQCPALVTVLHAGAGLFELLDANHDGALSLKELREAAGHVREAGAIVDGKFVARQLPAIFLATVSQGYPVSPLGTVERTGPAWFLAMDRNADGYVSRREFSGPADVFQKLDVDKDNLLTATEAGEVRP